MSSGRLATSSAVSNLLSRSVCFGWMPAFDPVSANLRYYLMSIHEQLPRQIRNELKQVGWSKAAELAKAARREQEQFKSADWLHKACSMPHQRVAEIFRDDKLTLKGALR